MAHRNHPERTSKESTLSAKFAQDRSARVLWKFPGVGEISRAISHQTGKACRKLPAELAAQ